MDILLNPITISVVIMCVLCLFKVNVLFSLIIAAIVAGITAGLSMTETIQLLVGGMGGNSETALSYILLGTFAASLAYTGISDILSIKISKVVNGKRIILIIVLAVTAMLSGTLIPVHIAFIPILVPPLLSMMNKMQFDRRAGACALAFGLKAPYITLPIGYGLIFQGIIADNMTLNGMAVTTSEIWKSTWILGIGMIVGLILSILYYSKKREYNQVKLDDKIIYIIMMKK